jgi:hypothetical protein
MPLTTVLILINNVSLIYCYVLILIGNVFINQLLVEKTDEIIFP